MTRSPNKSDKDRAVEVLRVAEGKLGRLDAQIERVKAHLVELQGERGPLVEAVDYAKAHPALRVKASAEEPAVGVPVVGGSSSEPASARVK